MKEPTVAVIGGGIAGLVAARSLATHFTVLLVEATGRLGGKLVSGSFRNAPFDLGPDSFITRNGSAVDLATELGLGTDLLAPASSSAAIYARGALRPFPNGLVLGVPTDSKALWRSGIVSRRGSLRAASDLLAFRARLPEALLERAEDGSYDESVEAIFGARVGREVARNLIDPLLGGINASDVTDLSLAASAPLLARAISGKRSVMRALRPLVTPRPEAGIPPVARTPLFFGLERGLGSLVEALERELRDLDVQFLLDTPVHGVKGHDAQLQLVFERETCEVAGAVVATPAFVTAQLLGQLDEALGVELASIPYAGVVTVAFAWEKSSAVTTALAELTRHFPMVRSGPGELPGAGVLVAKEHGRLVTAVTFTSTKWPRSAQPNEIVVRVSAGRHNDPRALELDDDALVLALRNELGEMLGIRAEPLEVAIERWPRSFPQYVRGHLARRSRIDTLVQSHGALALAGAAYDGIGIPACIDSGRQAAARVAMALGVPLEKQ